MFTESTEKINRSFKFLLLSRAARSMALIFVTLSLSLYLNILGYSLVFIGILYLVIVLFNMIFALILGMLGDRIGYAKSLIIGELLPLIALLGLALSSNIYIISVSAIIGGITGSAGGMRGAFSPGMTAYVASSWPEEHDRVGRLARINVVASVFSIFGGFFLIFHGYLSPTYGNVLAFRLLFVVSFFILLVSFISLMLLKERKRPTKTTHVMKKESFRYMMRLVLPNIINGAGIGMALPLLPLWFELRYGVSVSYVGEIFTLAYAATALGSYLSGKFLNSTHVRAITVSSIARTFQGLLLIIVAISPLVVLAFSLYAVRSAVAGLGAPMRSAISVRGIGNEDYGAASSIQGLSTRGSQMTSGASGYLMDAYFPLPLILGGTLQVAGAFVYYRLIRSWEKRREIKVT
ncbi:MAG: MFS transporter [Thermoplasmatales archaeon B_DKE]|nr:MAG: MFS transporter [Thermoplasmatales archaeon B_DKE]